MDLMLLRVSLAEMGIDCGTHARGQRKIRTRDTDGGGVTVTLLELTPYEWVSSLWGTLPEVEGYVWVNEEGREMQRRLRRNDTKCELLVRKEWHPDERGEQVSCGLVVEVKWS